MSDDYKIVWSDEKGDLRKKNQKKKDAEVEEGLLELHLRRLTSGKGRTVVEITNLPDSKSWCKKLAKDLKKALGVGGAYKGEFIEVHTKMLDKVIEIIESRQLKWKKIGG